MKIITLDNGLRIVHLPIDNEYIDFRINVCAGYSADTTVKDRHFSKSHYVEHVLTTQNQDKMKEMTKYIADSYFSSGFHTTNFEYAIHTNEFYKAFPLIIESLFKQKLDQETFIKQSNVIDIEYVVTSHDFDDPDDESTEFEELPIINKAETVNKRIMEKFSEKIKIDTSVKDASLIENAKYENVVEFYNQNYVPSKTIIRIAGGDNKMLDSIVFFCNNFFKNYPSKTPFTYDPKQVEEDNNTFDLNLVIPKDKYKINIPKPEASQRYNKATIYYPVAKKYSTNYYAASLYRFLLYGNNMLSVLISPLNRQLDVKRASTYNSKAFISDDYEKNYLAINVQTINPELKKALSGVRTVVNKIAKGKVVNGKNFKSFKQKYIKDTQTYAKLNQKNYLESVLDTMLISTDVKTYEEINNDISKLKYEDFANFANYVQKTNDFKIYAYGRGIYTDTLKAYDYVKPKRRKKQNAYTNKIGGKPIRNKKQDPEIREYL